MPEQLTTKLQPRSGDMRKPGAEVPGSDHGCTPSPVSDDMIL